MLCLRREAREPHDHDSWHLVMEGMYGGSSGRGMAASCTIRSTPGTRPFSPCPWRSTQMLTNDRCKSVDRSNSVQSTTVGTGLSEKAWKNSRRLGPYSGASINIHSFTSFPLVCLFVCFLCSKAFILFPETRCVGGIRRTR